MLLSSGKKVKFPGVYRRVKNNMKYFLSLMSLKDSTLVNVHEKLDRGAFRQRLLAWCDVVSRNSTIDYNISMDALKIMFEEQADLYVEGYLWSNDTWR